MDANDEFCHRRFAVPKFAATKCGAEGFVPIFLICGVWAIVQMAYRKCHPFLNHFASIAAVVVLVDSFSLAIITLLIVFGCANYYLPWLFLHTDHYSLMRRSVSLA